MPKLVTNGAELKCPFGTKTSKLKVLPVHKTRAEKNQAANIMDNKPMVNIQPFGNCTSPANPAVIAAMGAPQPCMPSVPLPWAAGSPTVSIDFLPALNDSSVCMCVLGGGCIMISDAGEKSVSIK